ncbi:uncharacterized protein Z518_10131 [Rhinocladiella mackenziei CBS 650.93]|uniref:Rhinocladiella mackenziei CBS 650.93 unplaced genomic scaffold supercont1.8, whole genome shotgun sequence n=1 Tax=Rhinocladiella mackenziei CBS 650.93 TaxID=1442369 RepID=A0A0D2IWS1_9EURO|nr:uncharacterized protein Z518_10131 [Rhinocladiella mackenziei CBS 650.93]KIX01065.1 hypothetical protein Z518_10131 [Rhinocladiella mackenziei CBS 650.93]
MEVGDGRSSSNDLSSAPPSDAESTPGPLSHLTAPYGHRDNATSDSSGIAGHLSARQTLPASAGAAAAASATSAGTRQEPSRESGQPPPVKTRKPRKRRDPNAAGEPEKEKKERATRRPRGASTTATTSRKKPKLEPTDDHSTIYIPRPNSSGLQSSTLVQPLAFSSTQAGAENRKDDAAKYSALGLSMHDAAMRLQPQSHLHAPIPNYRLSDYALNAPVPTQSTPPRAAGMYDPIRSVTIQRPVDHVPPSSTTLPPTDTPPRPTYNPSASPAISGIIDHPTEPNSTPPTTLATHPPKAEQPYSHANGKAVNSPLVKGNPATVEVDPITVNHDQPKKAATARKVPSEAPTRATSPKPGRAKEQAPPPPPGSGLLSASLFGGDSSSDAAPKDSGKGPNIVLHVDLTDPNNRVINFARMAEEKYGFAALYPRQAAQKERLAKVAAAGAALERSASGSKFGETSAGDSGDEDLSVDIERDSDNDGDVAMSGANGGPEPVNSGTDAPGPKRRRRRKMEEYNQDDPFIDDSELLWEAQAAASKDGFFVYCGPLVPEGEKPAVERADGTIKRGRGRGRGGGPGSRGGRGSAAASEGGAGRGGGPGSRGGGITRKPRMTKADRLQLEKEKLAREKMAPIMAKPTAYPG